jgi:peptidoglycan/xylan/chitin deacetylase (PgdA/CDA1 family)
MNRSRALPPLTLALHQTPARGSWSPMSVGARPLRRILETLLERGYAFRTVASIGPDGPGPGDALLTVDDGYASTVDVVAPLARELGIPWTVFILVGAVGGWNDWDVRGVARRERHLTEKEVRDLAETGAEIGSHGMTHRDFTRLDDPTLDAELNASRRWLEGATGREVGAVSYPWGRVDARVEAASRRAGYRLGFSLRVPRRLPASPLSLPRVAVYAPDQIPGLFRATVIEAPRQCLPLRAAAGAVGGWLVARRLAATGRAHA